MAPAHKAALARGREEGTAIRRYLAALEAHKPKRGRQRTTQSIRTQLAKIDEQLHRADPLTRVQLHQQRLNLEADLASRDSGGVDRAALERGFVKAVRPYSQRKGLTYTAWRAAGVDAAVLKKAGIDRGGLG
jgi:type I site-specific restriction endonuclease